MKYTVALLFALVVFGLLTTGHASRIEQCPNYPTASSALRIGDIIQDFVYQIIKTIVIVSEGIFKLFIPGDTMVPVREVLTEYAASPCQTLRVWTEVSLRLLNYNQLCPLLNFIPQQLQNIPLNADAISQFIISELQTCSPVDFTTWTHASSEFITQSVTSDIVYLFNTIPAL